MELALADHLQQRFQGKGLQLDNLVGVGVCFAERKSRGCEGDHGFFHESGTGIDIHHFAKMFGAVTGLLGEFALGGFQIIFAALFASGDDPRA